jgi:hypothetical protein
MPCRFSASVRPKRTQTQPLRQGLEAVRWAEHGGAEGSALEKQGSAQRSGVPAALQHSAHPAGSAQ